MDKILELEDITKVFPGVKALDGVSFNLIRGEIHALVGENGAGKSTLMKILSGIYKPTNGKIIFNGKEIVLENTKQAQILGITIIHQEFSLIPYLNSVDNIFLGRELRKKNGLLDRKLMKEKTMQLLKQINVEIDVDKTVDGLSVAEQQFVEIAKALSVNANLLILDEPTATLTVGEVKHLFDLMKTLKAKGVTMVFISHHMDEIFEIADRFSVLRDGKGIGTELVNKVTEDDIIRMMVGRELEEILEEQTFCEKTKQLLLEVKILKNKRVNGVSFKLNKGEILGISGLVGSGRSEVVRALIGADKADEKEIYMNEKKVNIKSPYEALKLGIALIPEDRKTQGLILESSVKDNVSLSSLNKVTNKYNFIDKAKERDIVEEYVSSLKIKTPDIDRMVKNLSGGNQQKVVIAKCLNTACEILIFDEPTRGIDVGAKAEIYKLMRQLVNKGASIIMISSELPEVLKMSDRILVMCKGKITGELSSKEANQEKIMYYATGGGINA
ncbi:sugar ABC transporter ATP-binding protein [Clostridium sp.]|uniref:sugar ABC transporter ATP-binding protein n=1 Tax=Clostridium sp. TaxID=1506 RepID=UPI003457A4C5